jgi:hypothetical protein
MAKQKVRFEIEDAYIGLYDGISELIRVYDESEDYEYSRSEPWNHYDPFDSYTDAKKKLISELIRWRNIWKQARDNSEDWYYANADRCVLPEDYSKERLTHVVKYANLCIGRARKLTKRDVCKETLRDPQSA